MNRIFVAMSALTALLAACGGSGDGGAPFASPPRNAPLVAEVDPFIGSANEGQTYPGAVYPNGMASVSPRTSVNSIIDLIGTSFLEGGASYSGYLDADDDIYGLGLTQLSGVGCPEFGLPLLTAGTGQIPTAFWDYESPMGRERAFAGYYGVEVPERGVTVHATATPRTGVLRFDFDSADGYVLVDASIAISLVRSTGEFRMVSDTEAEGSADFGQFCFAGGSGTLHFVVRFDRAAARSGLVQGVNLTDETSGPASAAYFDFDGTGARSVTAQVGLSWTSIDGARRNLDAEAVDSFRDALRQATGAWQERLSRIEVEGGTESDRRKFYTALYHTQIHPSIASDVDGAYLTFGDPQRVEHSDEAQYTVFSLWDTYRTLHPLLTLVYPELQLAMLRSMSNMTTASGRPPRWELGGDEVQMMVGDPAAIVFADSYAKGLTDFPAAEIYPLLVAAASDTEHRRGVDEYLRLGYVPMELAGAATFGGVWGPAATTLEYSYSDWSIARLAELLGHPDDVVEFEGRAVGYRQFFDTETGTLRPRQADGGFLTPYDPDLFLDIFAAGTGGPGFVEGTAWQYAFMVPHDLPALVGLHGESAFIDRLQAFFDEGRFTSFNEPDIGYPYMFGEVAGEAHRTQQQVRAVVAQDYSVGPSGLPGNDDAGTLSAWLVFSMMGFYPLTPGLPEYRLGSPTFDRVVIHLSAPHHSGTQFEIVASGNGPEQVYTHDIELNGSPLAGPTLMHADVTAGGTLSMTMSAAR